VLLSLRAHVKSVLSPMVRAAWPVVKTIGELEARVTRGQIEVRWSEIWTPEFDRALETLPPLPDCPHDLYRTLVKATRAKKRHALVREDGKVIAVISLRQAARHWEPVAYQCVPGAIAPAADTHALARALNALGAEVRVPAGVGEEVAHLNPSDRWGYDTHKIDLSGDYDAHWRARSRLKRIRRAIRDTAHLERRVNGPGDLEWTIEQWREQWKDDAGEEVNAADDRLNFWSALAKRENAALKLVTLVLADGEKRVAGFIVLVKDGVAMSQCSVRDQAYNDAGTASYLFAVDWADANGLSVLDLGSGPYKNDWGPVAGRRYGVVFRPRVMSALSWACTY
jgi:CelD/BcsL family acetyltransferase involved in cellulose biosynthesis